jgi:hypothetical protein
MDVPSLIVIVVVALIVIFTLGFLVVQHIDRCDLSVVDVDVDANPALFDDSADYATGVSYDETFMAINIHHDVDHSIAHNTSNTFED